MNRLVLVPAALVLLLVTAAAPARAQYPQYPAAGLGAYSPYATPYLYSQPQVPFPGAGGPRLSPYLNLLRNGTNPAVNYYLGVVPERDRRRFQAQTSAQLQGLRQELANPLPVTPEDEFAPNPAVTGGYVAVFNNTGGYFPQPGVARTLPAVPPRTQAPRPTKK